MASTETGSGHWLRDRRVIIMVLLGAVSGTAGNFTTDVEWLGGPLSIGIIFGVVIGAYLVMIGLATVFRAVGFALCSIATWMIAYRAAARIANALPESIDETMKYMIAGIIAGLVGAGLLAGAIAVLFPYFRRWRFVLRTALVGMATGALLVVLAVEDSRAIGILLFAPWQAAFALCFALEFPPDAKEKSANVG